MKNDGYYDELFTLMRQSQSVELPQRSLNAYQRFEKDYQKACREKGAPFSQQLVAKQWDQLEKESKEEYQKLAKRDSIHFEQLLSFHNQIQKLSHNEPSGKTEFIQEKGQDSLINIDDLYAALSEGEKNQYVEIAKKNKKENIKALIEDYITQIQEYAEKQNEVPQQLQFIPKKEEEKDELDQIDIIIGIKRINGKKEYLVRFKGKTGKDAKWFPKKKLRNVKEMVKEFEEAYFKQSFQEEESSSGFDSTPAQQNQVDNKKEKIEENQDEADIEEDPQIEQQESQEEKKDKRRQNTTQRPKEEKINKKIVIKQKKVVKPLVKVLEEERVQVEKEQPRSLRASEKKQAKKNNAQTQKNQSQSIEKSTQVQKKIKSSSQEVVIHKDTQKEQQQSRSKQRSQQKEQLVEQLRPNKKDTGKQNTPTQLKQQPKKIAQKKSPETPKSRTLRSKSTTEPTTKTSSSKPVNRSQSQKSKPNQEKKQQIIKEKKVIETNKSKEKQQNQATTQKVQTRLRNEKPIHKKNSNVSITKDAANNKQKVQDVKKTIQKKKATSNPTAPVKGSSKKQEKKAAPKPIQKKIVKTMTLRKRK